MQHLCKKDISKFKHLILIYYGENVSMEEAERRLDSLVRLLRLVSDFKENKKLKNK